MGMLDPLVVGGEAVWGAFWTPQWWVVSGRGVESMDQ